MERKSASWVWAGAGITMLSAISYIPLFVRFPSTRDFPWVNLLLFAAGLGVLGVGFARAYREQGQYPMVRAAVLAIISVGVVAVFLFGNFVFARRVPASAGAPRVGQTAPPFTLADANGKSVSLADMLKANRAVLLIFYRGYW